MYIYIYVYTYIYIYIDTTIYADHPAFDVRFERKQEKEKEKDGVQKRRGGPGQLSDRKKAKLLQQAEKAQEAEDFPTSFRFAFKVPSESSKLGSCSSMQQ